MLAINHIFFSKKKKNTVQTNNGQAEQSQGAAVSKLGITQLSAEFSSSIEHYKTLKGSKRKVLAHICCFFKPVESGECLGDIKK